MDNKRRSSRSRKKVKYAKFSESSDDDFEGKNTLVSKKQKGEKNDVSKSNKKKLERMEAKSATSDVLSRLSGSEKVVLHKDIKIPLQSYQEDRKPKHDSKHGANSENYDRIEAIQEQGENSCNTELNRKTKHKNKNKLDMEKDVEYTISSEEEEEGRNVDNKDWKENSDEPDGEKSKSNEKSQAKMKEDGEYTSNEEKEDKNADDKDWKENSDESDDGKRRLNKKPQANMKKEKGACMNYSKTPARQAKKQAVQTHSTAKSKVVNYCAKQPLSLPAVKLRLGLSRKASIKPLHPVVKVQQ